jgi:hypothetical protein
MENYLECWCWNWMPWIQSRLTLFHRGFFNGCMSVLCCWVLCVLSCWQVGWRSSIHKHILILLCLYDLHYCDLNKTVCYINKHLCLTAVHCLYVFFLKWKLRGDKTNKLWSHLKTLQNLHFFKMKLNLILLEQNFLSVQEYLSYEFLSWKM